MGTNLFGSPCTRAKAKCMTKKCFAIDLNSKDCSSGYEVLYTESTYFPVW
jgi:hypothetical protein